MSFGRFMVRTGMAASGVAWAVAVATMAAQAPAKSVNDGVYSTSQAGRGQALFQSLCTTCHAPDRFTGEEFVSAWSGKPIVELFKAVQTMPEDNPGSLSAQQYADVMAYFLSLNKYPAGSDELKGDADALSSIQFEAARP
jgi:S-disulfanyl-L-cysteine oxidoreductase SoxD